MISPTAFRVGGMWIIFVSLVLGTYYLLKRKIHGWAKILSPSFGFFVVMACYRFDLFSYLSDCFWIRDLLIENMFSLAIFGVLAVALALTAYHFSFKIKPSSYRSLYHFLVFVVLGASFFVHPDFGFLCLSFVTVAFIFVETIRVTHPKPARQFRIGDLFALLKEKKITDFLVHLVHQAFSRAFRQAEEFKLYMAGFFAVFGLLLVFIALPYRVALTSLFILALADPAAAFCGRRYGWYRWSHNPIKSLEGSLAAFVVTFSVVFIFGFSPLTAGVVALSIMVFESLPLQMSDNLLLPVLSGLLLLTPL